MKSLFLRIKLMLKQLSLYSTSHCHLCELAQALVMQISSTDKVKLVDITEDDALLAQYELRIPVLQCKIQKQNSIGLLVNQIFINFLNRQ